MMAMSRLRLVRAAGEDAEQLFNCRLFTNLLQEEGGLYNVIREPGRRNAWCLTNWDVKYRGEDEVVLA